MAGYDDFPISEAHRKALEARKKFYEDNPDKLTDLPDEVKAAAPSLGECNAHYDHASACYTAATAAWAAHHPEMAAILMQEATNSTHAGHACIDRIIHENPF